MLSRNIRRLPRHYARVEIRYNPRCLSSTQTTPGSELFTESLINSVKSSLSSKSRVCIQSPQFFENVLKKIASLRDMVSLNASQYQGLHNRVLSGIPNTPSNADIRANVTLQFLLSSEHVDYKGTCRFIVDHIACSFRNELLESFIVSLIQQGRLAAATSILHIFLDKQPHFKLSNQSWSLMLTSVCEQSDIHGASLIYNEIIENHAFYDDGNYSALLSNNRIPFLITPGSIESLATIFAHNANDVAIEGLKSYFQRFYSYNGHPKTYETLGICAVEAASKKEDYRDAMQHFVNLAYKYVDHKNGRRHLNHTEIVKSRIFTQYRERRVNIRSARSFAHATNLGAIKSSIDEQNDEAAEKFQLQQYTPYEEYNIYTQPDRSYIPILLDHLRVSDLPHFKALVKKNLARLYKSEARLTDVLLNSLSKSHFMLHIFFISSLCELGLPEPAFTLLAALPTHFPRADHKTLYKEDNFNYLLKAIYERITASLDDPTASASAAQEENFALLSRVKEFHNTAACCRGKSLPTKAFTYYLSAMMFNPSLRFSDLKRELDYHFSLNRELHFMNSVEYDILAQLCAEDKSTRYLGKIRRLEN